MLPSIKLDLDSVQLFEAQARVGAKLKEFDEVKSLSIGDYDKFINLLREYSQMLQMDIMRNHAVIEKKAEPEAVPVPKHEQYEYYGPAVPKDIARQKFDENFERVFGRKPKKIA